MLTRHASTILAGDLDMRKVKRIGFDETSKKKGHKYITSFIDLDTGELLYIGEGKSSEVVEEFAEVGVTQGLDIDKVSDVSIDMSPAFIAGATQVFPKATITVDKFHVSQLVQKAFDGIRKSVGRLEGGTINKWLFFKPMEKLKEQEVETIETLFLKYPLLQDVYQLKNDFKMLWEQESKKEASAFLSFWADKMRAFKKKGLTRLANTLDKHHERIIHVIESKINNAILEGFNSKVQLLKRKARGYKETKNLILIIQLHCTLINKPT